MPQTAGYEVYQFLGCSGAGVSLATTTLPKLPIAGRSAGYGSDRYNAPDAGNMYNVTDSTALNFGDIACVGLITNAPTLISSNRLHFSSVPAPLTTGMRAVNGEGPIFAQGVTGRIVIGSGSNYVDLDANVSSMVPSGALVIFDSSGMPSNNYKIWFDGTAYRRCG